MNENKLSIKILPEHKEQITAALTTISSILENYCISLNPDERRELPKMGEKTTNFVIKAFELAEANPNFKPQYLDLQEMKKDIDAYLDFRPLTTKFQQISENAAPFLITSRILKVLITYDFFKS